ncbi:hypothetical protein ILUMI_01628 [Ignelater luminosus]|uniref:Uncharacterized protein n=1 Tax=Ignelater luminosus TaxID=2038154 RepID=A0A8K0GM23_IGNLU|nr:hypothetical protein ILUMI_01628 [Ignelater luminosus]
MEIERYAIFGMVGRRGVQSFTDFTASTGRKSTSTLATSAPKYTDELRLISSFIPYHSPPLSRHGYAGVPEILFKTLKDHHLTILTGHGDIQMGHLLPRRGCYRTYHHHPKALRGRSKKQEKQLVSGFDGQSFMDDVKVLVQLRKEKNNRKSLRARKQTKRAIFGDDEELEDPYTLACI